MIQTRKGSEEVVFEEQAVGGMLGAATIAQFQGRETRFGQRNSIEPSGKKSGCQWVAAVNGLLLRFGWLWTHQGDILWPKTVLNCGSNS